MTAMTAAAAPSHERIGVTTETGHVWKAVNAVRYAGTVMAAAAMARPMPRAVRCGAPVAATIGTAARVPIASDHTNTGTSPTRRMATASGTSGTPQSTAASRPRTIVTSAHRMG